MSPLETVLAAVITLAALDAAMTTRPGTRAHHTLLSHSDYRRARRLQRRARRNAHATGARQGGAGCGACPR